MKKRFYTFATTFALLLALFTTAAAQVTCVPNGNLFCYVNYDGGVLNIDVNVNIPNIKIGICTYEPTTINITGAYAGNVTEVRYAGYVSTTNHHCSNSPSTTTITGVPANITSVNFLPPSTLSNPNGYTSIVCGYTCSTNTNQGGCNTADQIKDYFQVSTGGQLTSYFTQYGCWSTQPYQLSAGGNCCSSVVLCNLVANAGANQSICPGGQATLAGSATGGATTYSWSPTSGLGSPNSASTTASPSVTTTYILTASDGGVCSDQDTVVVTVFTPQAQIGPFPLVCIDAAPLTLPAGNPAGGIYSGPGVNNGIFDPATAGVGTHTLSYSVTDGNNCLATTTATIVVAALPTVTFGPIGPFCENDPAILLTTGSPSGGGYSGNGVSNGVFDPGAAGIGGTTLVYTYVDQNGCVNAATHSVSVNANPNAPVLNFAAPTLSTSASGDSIQWFLNGQHTVTNGSSIVPTTSGNYSAIVWVNGCPSDTSAALLVELVGLDNGFGNVHVQAWPNPAGDVLHVQVAGIRFEATVSDAMGRVVRTGQWIDSEGMISIAGLGKGVYFLRIQGESGNANLKIMKQ